MKKLTFYLEKRVIISLSIILFAVIVLLLLLQSLRFLDLIMNRGLSATILIYMAVITIPSFLVETLPIALLISLIFTWTSMIASQEIIIMQTAGLSPWKISSSLIKVGIAVSLISLSIVWYIMPQSYIAYHKLKTTISKSYNIKLIEAGKFVNINDDLTFYVKKITGNEFNNIIIYNDKSKRGKATILAEKGVVDFDYNSNTIIFLLDNVIIQEVESANGNVSFITLDKYIFDFYQDESTSVFQRQSTNSLYLHELFLYKNLPFIQGIDHQSDYYKNIVYDIGNERNRRVANALFPLILSIITAYYFTTSSFNRQGNRKPLFKTLIVFGILKTLVLIIYFAPVNIILATLGTFLPIPISIYMLYKIIYPPKLQNIK